MKFNDFLSMAVSDSVNAYASGVREDAGAVGEGLSRDVRGECPECGRHLTLRNKGEDGRCQVCTDKPVVQARTPELLRGWAHAMRVIVDMSGKDFPVSAYQASAQVYAWEREADELEAKVECWNCHHALGDHDEKECRGGEDLPCRCDSFIEPEAKR